MTARTGDRLQENRPSPSSGEKRRPLPWCGKNESPPSSAAGAAGSNDADTKVTLDRLTRGVFAPAFAIDQSGRLISVNGRLAALLEIEAVSAISQHCSQICLGPADRDLGECGACPIRSLPESGEGSEAWTVNLLQGSGRALPARLTAIACEGGLLVVIGGAGARPDEPALVRASCLGAFSAQLPDGTSLRSRRPKALTLLKLLLVERPQPVAEARIVGALWPSGTPARGLRALRVLVHDLRRALEPGLTDGRASRFVQRQSESYVIPEGAPLEVDIDRFCGSAEIARRAAAAGRFEQAEQEATGALQLYRGDLFSPDTAANWFVSHRRRLKSTWLDMLTLHAALLRRAGRSDEALEQLQRVVDADLLREDAHRLLLLLLARDRGRDAALQHFVDMTASFKARFGLPPSRETGVLVNSILRGEDLSDVESMYFLPGDPAAVREPDYAA